MKDWRTRLGRQLRELRRRHALTQEQLGERAGLSYKFIGEIERGTGNPTVATLMRLADALDVDVVDLFGETASDVREWYPLPEREIKMVREALRSLEEKLQPSESTRKPRRRRRKPRG